MITTENQKSHWAKLNSQIENPQNKSSGVIFLLLNKHKKTMVLMNTWYCYAHIRSLPATPRQQQLRNSSDSLHNSRGTARRLQPACVASRICLANNIGLLISARSRRLSSSCFRSPVIVALSASSAVRRHGKSYFSPDYDRQRAVSPNNSRENLSHSTRRKARRTVSVTYI